MSSGKVYYWLKLNKDFFEDDTITWIEEQENGKDYIIFYLKLSLRSLQDEGYLIRYVGEKLIPYDVKALAKLTNTSPDTVAVAMKLFIEIGLISRLDSGEIYLNQIDEMIGSETESAKRVRRHRAKKEMLQSNNIPLQCNNDVIKSNTELEKELEIDKEIEIDKETEEEQEEADKIILSKKLKEKIITEWNKLPVPNIRTLSQTRSKKIKILLQTYGEEDIFKAIDNINESKFLQGINDRGWVITIDWFVNSNNFVKVLEGNYNNKKENLDYKDYGKKKKKYYKPARNNEYSDLKEKLENRFMMQFEKEKQK